MSFRWLDTRQDDGEIEREIYPAGDQDEKYDPFIPYEIVTYTSDIRGTSRFECVGLHI